MVLSIVDTFACSHGLHRKSGNDLGCSRDAQKMHEVDVFISDNFDLVNYVTQTWTNCPLTVLPSCHVQPRCGSVGEVWSVPVISPRMWVKYLMQMMIKRIRVFFCSFSSIPAFCLYTVPGIKVINQYDKK